MYALLSHMRMLSLDVLPNGWKHGDVVSCVVVKVNEGYVDLSLRPSRLVSNALRIYCH